MPDNRSAGAPACGTCGWAGFALMAAGRANSLDGPPSAGPPRPCGLRRPHPRSRALRCATRHRVTTKGGLLWAASLDGPVGRLVGAGDNAPPPEWGGSTSPPGPGRPPSSGPGWRGSRRGRGAASAAHGGPGLRRTGEALKAANDLWPEGAMKKSHATSYATKRWCSGVQDEHGWHGRVAGCAAQSMVSGEPIPF